MHIFIHFTGLIVAGGYDGRSLLSSVEFLTAAGDSCSLPVLPYTVTGHTLDMVEDTLVACGGGYFHYTSCVRLNGE